MKLTGKNIAIISTIDYIGQVSNIFWRAIIRTINRRAKNIADLLASPIYRYYLGIHKFKDIEFNHGYISCVTTVCDDISIGFMESE